jgi:predicted permease
LLVTALGMNIYTAIDARATPAEVFESAGQNRTLWMTLSLIGAFLSVVGIAIAGYYLLRVRPLLRPEIQARGLGDEVSGRTKVVRYLLPGLVLAAAIALSASGSGGK